MNPMKIFFLCVVCIFPLFLNGYEVDINSDYVLRPDLMPGSLLMLDSSTEFSYTNSSKHFQEPGTGKLSFNGSWYDAYSTMGFHRKMFNEYLCRNFLADEIISQMQQPLISRRIGRPFSKMADKSHPTGNRKSRADAVDVKDNLLADPGSSNYRDWLSKTATLEDVYRHYDMSVSRAGEDIPEEEYDGGEFTGYAMPGPANAAGKIDFGPGLGGGGYGPPGFMPQQGLHGEADKYGEGGYEFAPHHVHFHDSEGEKSSHHGLALNDMFDIALTALAFLSFGMFILQVIMCITSSKPMMPMMQMTDTEEPEAGQDEFRFKRDTFVPGTSINDLARRILNSIEAGVQAQQDGGSCLRWSLCDNNKYSRSLKDSQKIWIPVWSLGMSWLSSRFIQGPPSTSAMLESLRACALGLARVDCSELYSDCNLHHLLANRKTNRRKRAVPSSGRNKGDVG